MAVEKSEKVDSMKNYVIDNVNMKLRIYNKPFCLALAIGIMTYIGCAACFVLQTVDCTMTGVTFPHMLYAQEFLQSGDHSCINNILIPYNQAATKNAGNLFQYLPCEAPVGFKYCHAGARTNNNVEFTCPWYTQACFQPFLDACNAGQTLPGEGFERNGIPSEKQCFEPLEARNGGTDLQDKGLSSNGLTRVPVYIGYSQCPSMATSFGAALGYAAIFELVFTIPIVFLSEKCGVVSKIKKGGWSALLKDAAKESVEAVQDNVKEEAAEVVVP